MEEKSLPLCDLFSFETRHFDAGILEVFQGEITKWHFDAGILEVFQGEITKYRKKRNAKT